MHTCRCVLCTLPESSRCNVPNAHRPQTNAVIELNGLKIAEDRSFADCARYIFTTMLALCLPAPPRVALEYGSLFQAKAPNVATQVGHWGA